MGCTFSFQGGADLATCIAELTYTCGSAASSVATAVAGTIFGDKCKGHASPYHFHVDMACEYSPNAAASASAVSAHSPLVGLALDGRGIYGAWESASTLPTLDACNGHVGPTPGTASATSGGVLGLVSDISGLASSTSVYHYHMSANFPYTIGCFANANTTTAACQALYPTCNSYVATHYANGSTYFYDDWCPCGSGGPVTPAIAINTLPTNAGATCKTFNGGSNPTTSGYSTCTLALLGINSTSSPPPPSPPGVTSSPPPPLPPPATTVLPFTMTLQGVTVAQFNSTLRTAFIATLATRLSVSASAIAITSVTASTTSGRHLLQNGINVAFTVTTAAASSTTLTQAVNTITTTGATSFVTALSAAGVPTTGVLLATTPSPPPPATTSGAPGGQPATMVLALATGLAALMF